MSSGKVVNSYMLIYADTNTCKWNLKNISVDPAKIYDDLGAFLAIDSDKKSAMFHIPYPLDNPSILHDKLNRVIKAGHHAAVLMSEIHNDTVSFFRTHQHPNIKYFICGTVEHCPSSQWMDWLYRTTDFYKKNPQVLDKLTPYQTKEKIFDILLGRNKPHRTAVYDFIINNNLNNNVIMTYLKGNDTLTLQEQNRDGWIWEDTGLVLPDQEFTWTVTPVKYQGRSMSLSQVMPLTVYNQTAYSRVAETNSENGYSFFTEKIVKPILAERLFLVFSGQHYLKNLRSLGFKTFNGIIDEHYDSVADSTTRFGLIFEQMQYLFSQPQEQILEQIRPITEHNKKVMLETDWYGDFSKELKQFLFT